MEAEVEHDTNLSWAEEVIAGLYGCRTGTVMSGLLGNCENQALQSQETSDTAGAAQLLAHRCGHFYSEPGRFKWTVKFNFFSKMNS